MKPGKVNTAAAPVTLPVRRAVDLNGQLRVLLHGKVDTGPGGGIRNSFEVVPDAPVSRFTLSLNGGNKGLWSTAKTSAPTPKTP